MTEFVGHFLVFTVVSVVFLILPVTVLFAFYPGVIGLSFTTP